MSAWNAWNFSSMMLHLAFGSGFLFLWLMTFWVEEDSLFSLKLSIVSLLKCRSSRRAKSGDSSKLLNFKVPGYCTSV